MASDKKKKAGRDGGGGTVAVTIRLEPGEAARLADIVGALEAAGLTGVDTHARLMMVNGDAPAEAMAKLRKVKGVASVREDKVYRALDKKP